MRIVSTILISLVLTACCTQKDCLNVFDLNTIKLINFNSIDTDSILIRSYTKGSNFSSRIDSQYTSANDISIDNEGLTLYVPIPFTHENDYTLFFTKTEDYYEITNIKTDSETCNSCFLSSDDYMVLSSYDLNGITQTSSYFELIK
jgi:hypothetical protein